MNEKPVKERIKEILKEKKSNVTNLSKLISIPQNTLTRQINGTTSIPTSSLLSILGLFEDISAEWLMRGIGHMFRHESAADDPRVEALKAEINMLRGENRVLREQLGLPDRKETATLSA